MPDHDSPGHEWTGGKLPTFVTHLECSLTGERYQADRLHGLSRAGRPLLVRYDLDGVRRALPREALADAAADPVALPRDVAGAPAGERGVARRGGDAAGVAAAHRRARQWQGGEILVKDEGRLPTGSFKARGLVLAVSMAKELGVTAHGDADQRQCRRGDGRLLRARRHQGDRVLPRRHAGGECARDRDAGRRGLPRRRADRRLRQARRRGREEHRLVQLLDPARALPHRGQEDDGHRAGRAARLGTARRDLLSDRRRHRHHRHVEGLRRAGGARLDRHEAAAHGRGAGRGLRADGQGLGRRASSTRRAGRTRTPSPPASGCRRRSAIF